MTTLDLASFFALPASRLPSPLVRAAERMLGFHALGLLHRSLEGDTAKEQVRRALEGLGVDVAVLLRATAANRGRLPATGGAIVVANLPNGLIDGLALGKLLLDVRSDVKLLVARRERRLPELGGLLFDLDEKGKDPARNSRVLRAAISHVEKGGLLALFPAMDEPGLPIDHSSHDGPWAPFVATIARRAEAPVIPVYIEPSKPSFFRSQVLKAPRLRRYLEPNALLSLRGVTVRARVGHSIGADAFSRFAQDRELTDYFRLRTSLLGRTALATVNFPARQLAPLAPPIESALVAAEIDGLPRERLLASGGDLDVFVARASEIENVLLEIGRLRELTFRAVDEGCGSSRDLDRHDADYRHLVLWDRRQMRIAGGYRLGLTDELTKRGGNEALYTHSLFEYGEAFLSRISPAIELGRSFVVPEYQRSILPLDLLWRGIGAFLRQNPRYSTLFGPVTISGAYDSLSRELIVEHIEQHQFDSALARCVRARTPPRKLDPARTGLRWTRAMVENTIEVSRMVTEVEPDEKGIPVLVREYLKLGGQFVGFNVDASFGDCLDGLVIVDVKKMPQKYKKRYLGA